MTMELTKDDYSGILALFHRVDHKGIGEAQALVLLAQKIAQKVTNWDAARTSAKNPET